MDCISRFHNQRGRAAVVQNVEEFLLLRRWVDHHKYPARFESGINAHHRLEVIGKIKGNPVTPLQSPGNQGIRQAVGRGLDLGIGHALSLTNQRCFVRSTRSAFRQEIVN